MILTDLTFEDWVTGDCIFGLMIGCMMSLADLTFDDFIAGDRCGMRTRMVRVMISGYSHCR